MSAIELINNFLFEYKIHSSFAAFLRISVTSYFIFMVLASWDDIKNFTNPLGILNYKVWKNLKTHSDIPLDFFTLFDFAKNSKILSKVILYLFFLFGILSLVGLFTNISLAIFFILYISISHRAHPILINNGYVIEKLILFPLVFIDCGSQYSLDQLIGISSNINLVDGWGARIVQVTMPYVYFISTVSKGSDKTWQDGNVLRYVFMNSSISRSLMKYFYKLIIQNNKFILTFLTKSTVYFEYFAPLLFIFSETRLLALIFFTLMHLSIIIFFKIDYFGSTAIIALLYFLNQYFY